MLPQKFVSAGNDYCTYEKNVPAPIFRKSFRVSNIKNASLVIGATGFYDLYLNGEKITCGYLAPYISNPDDVIFYDSYDLSDKLLDGENTICVILGNGFANPIGGEIWNHRKDSRCAPSFALEFVSDDVQFDSANMKWCYSHILFDDMRCGVFCDMTKYNALWFSSSFDDSCWNLPTMRDYSHSVKKLRTSPPVRGIRRVSPISFEKGELRDYRMRDCFLGMLYNGETIMEKTPLYGGYIYDFGENCAGVPKLRIKGEYGQKIHMQFCEVEFEGFPDYINIDVYPDGCCQKDVYVCNGEGVEEFIPPFTYHGYRYCYIYGITEEQATSDLLEMIVLHNDVKMKTSFSCSDDISEEIFNCCRRSDLSNLVNNITDCPAREKNGWTGDASISAEHFMQHYEAEECFAEWLFALRHTMDDSGRLPLIVPSGEDRFEHPVWDSAIVFLPYHAYIYSGNKDIIKDNAAAMLENFKFHLSNKDERGIVEKGFGDWLPVDCAAAEYASPLGFCCTAILIEECRMMEIMFSAIGNYDDAKFVAEEKAKLISAIRAEYNQNGIIGCGRTKKYVQPTYRPCQTSQALGLAFGIFEKHEEEIAIKKLVDLIREKKNSFDCGFLGLRYIFRCLSKYGYSDLCYDMITKPSHPSYANMIYRGCTSIWERFVKPHGRTGSYNHHFMADVSGWYIETVIGIKVNPNYNDPDNIVIEPHFITQLKNASGTYETKKGKISVEWCRYDDRINLCIKTKGDVSVSVGDKILNNDKVDVFISELS